MDRARPLIDWLVSEAAHVADMGAFVDGLAARLLAAGVPVSRVASMVETLHPRFVGMMRVWEPGGDLRARRATFDDPDVVAPKRVYTIDELQETGRPFEMRLDDPAVDRYELLPRLRDEGHTHYLMLPLRFRAEPLHGISFATRRPRGFSADDRALLDAVLPALTVAMNVVSSHGVSVEVLQAYVGAEPAGRILKGAIRRGDVRRIRAALYLSDLRGFTRLAVSAEPEATVAAVNAYLDRVVPPVVAGGGEVLKFMGDGVLAIFPIDAAAREALASADRGRIGVALHVGEAAYGNIGAGDRLDFTIIGRDVNLLARIEKLCGVLGEDLVMSADFAARLPAPGRALGEFELKGFDGKVAVFAP
jgi:adenylate cyclase